MDTPRTGKTKKKIVSKVIKFPLHKVRKPKKGKLKTIFQAFEIILDDNKMDKYLRK